MGLPFLNRRKKHRTQAVVIDLGSKSTKVVSLQRKGGGIEFDNFAVLDSPDENANAPQQLGQHLKAAYDGGRPVVRADRGQIHQALTNLVNNAIKFSPEGREVVVEVAPSVRSFAQLIVRDSGPGIPAQHLTRIFDRGYRVPGAKAEGSGLGLYITHQILGMHGCTIKASSPEGGGAVFRLTLPLAREGKPLDPPRNAPRTG